MRWPCGGGVDRYGVFGALLWWGHRCDSNVVPVVCVGSEGVYSGGDDVVGLSLQDHVALHAKVLR